MADAQVPILAVENLQTHFIQDEGVVRAVDGASFEVFAGRTLGIVGESGCGKSMTARSILRIVEKPGRVVGGRIRYWRQGAGGSQEIDLTALPADGKEMRAIRGDDIALIFQEPMTSFSQHYTVGNQIVEAIRLHRPVSKAEARQQAIELLRSVGVPRPEQRIDSYSFQLSGGLRQRVMIAMALSCNPKILIADEPTTALDVTTQAQILELLRRLQREYNMAIMLITHDMGVIAEMADDVVVMYLGRVVEQGPVEQIFHEPRHPYTRALLRSIPSIRAEPRTRLTTLEGAIPHPFNRPRGCPFNPRCPARIPRVCDRHAPALVAEPGGRAVSCFLYHDQLHGEGAGRLPAAAQEQEVTP
jgi:peptide/nickel transport system ATP-binding protein